MYVKVIFLNIIKCPRTKNVKNILGIEYLKFGFILSPTNEKLHLCLICEKIFSDEAMKPSRIKDDFIKKHQDKSNKNILYSNDLKNKFEKR